MNRFTLRQKFKFGLIAVVVVSLLVLIGTRLLGKAALFHYMERDHVATVLNLKQAMDRVSEGARTADKVTRDELVRDIVKARDIAGNVDIELFAIERGAISMIGFGGVIDLPRKDIVELNRMRDIIASEPGSGVTPELVAKLKPDMDQVLDNTNRFGPLVAEVVNFIKVSVMFINLLGIAVLATSFWLIRQATLGPLQTALAAAHRIAQGDLSGTLSSTAQDEVGKLIAALEDMQSNLVRVVGDVRQRSHTVAQSMGQMASGSSELASRTERQAAALQQTAATMEEITATVKQSAQSVNEANRLARDASTLAAEGGQAVVQAVQSMDAIKAASKKIAEITTMINGISFQTNILALNAAVESARAGEHGRGFAVVAAEVRTLAQRSATAAKEIEALIRDSVDKVEAGSAQVGQAGQTIDQVVAAVGKVGGLIGDLAHAFAEQESGIAQIDQAIVELDQVTQQNAAMVQRAAASATSVRAESEALVQSVSVFKLAH
ncbi:methyl-accepting chemotaxis protein [Caldimonas brevitalea]|uniref:Methyl-accepting chemotaxis protein I serine chemoreceptor protein n=1 Tax=Caldimonas brevitalea TaxID=413882 RepID=A0A0G3BMC1_9BURK|nr:methyl-accepting chemotaxis protein [Caldimonas brevitalea]AKJ30557.1 methyl-accepting chemotaxis protein I serine chemoreceptor protein [Caldimonas brevitalea]